MKYISISNLKVYLGEINLINIVHKKKKKIIQINIINLKVYFQYFNVISLKNFK